ncbi:MAG: hypothetical protein OXU19_15455 [bacterium]|nr:hypothetical protein [bacterium]MDE0242781.1 hypothetical protein [bacterium]
MTRQFEKQRSLHCPPCEQEMNRVSAEFVGKAVSDHLLDLVRDDDDVVQVLVLSPED